MILSNTILTFNFTFNAFVDYLNISGFRARLGFSIPQLDAINLLRTSFNDFLIPYVAPDTNNEGSVSDMNGSYKVCSQLRESYVAQIAASTTVVLTGRDRMNLDIPMPSTRKAKIEVPDFGPAIFCVSKRELLMNMIACNPTNPFKRAKPPGAYSIGMKMVIVKAGNPPPNPEDYILQPSVKSTEFELLFTTPDVGSTVYLICFYINNRGEFGPDSMPVSVVII